MAALMRIDACNIFLLSVLLAYPVTSMVYQIIVSFGVVLHIISGEQYFSKASLFRRCRNSCFLEHERFKQETACTCKPLSKQHFT